MRHALIGILFFILACSLLWAALPFTDAFTAADGTNFASYSANWTVVSTAGVIYGNAAGAYTGGNPFMAKDNSNTYSGSQIATGIIKSPSNGTYVGVGLNMTTGYNGYLCWGDSNEFFLTKHVNNQTNLWVATTPTVQANDEVRGWRDGNDLHCQLWRSGVLQYDSGAVTDTAHTAGSPGIGGFGGVSSSSYTRIDDISLNDYSAGGSAPIRRRPIMMFFTLPEFSK